MFVFMQCLHEGGHAETRVCHVDNILLHKEQLLYLYSGMCYAWEMCNMLCLLSTSLVGLSHHIKCTVPCLSSIQLRLTKGIAASMTA